MQKTGVNQTSKSSKSSLDLDAFSLKTKFNFVHMMDVCMYVCMRIYRQTDEHTYLHTYIYMYTVTYVHACIYIHTYRPLMEWC